MTPPSTRDITQMLQAWQRGGAGALEKLTPLVFAELRRLAHRRMRAERPHHTLQTTALVHEAYVRLVDGRQVQWQDRAHFFALSSRLMRRILVDYARSRHRLKRGGKAVRVSLDEAMVSADKGQELVALDEALKALEEFDPRKSRIVELRFFGGLSVKETAEVLKVSMRTVVRDWRLAKVWLHRETQLEKAHEPGTLAAN